MTTFSALPLFISLLISTIYCAIIDLGNDPSPHQNQWNFYSIRRNISGKVVQIPGDIFADLEANGFINGDPLYGQGDRLNRWVGHEDWTYERSMELAEEVENATFVLLQIQGLDGLAEIWLNSQHVATVDNQFRSYSFNVKPFIVLGLNVLRISFQSPVKVAKKRANIYRVLNLHALPPECPPPIYNGECHVNQLRKMQASFSWDWGPSMPTIGIWRSIWLEYFQQLSIQQFSPMIQTIGNEGEGNANFLVNVSISLHCVPKSHFSIQLSLPELSMTSHFEIRPIGCPNAELHNLSMFVPRKRVKLWWPRGYGQQPLYRLELAISVNGKMLASAEKRIAFRTIRLNQSPVNESNSEEGRLFQFEVNELPIFLKGTNWVPISVFPARSHSIRRQFLFHSMAEANINALRVWGGGIYEEDAFYDLADEFGFLIWQDFMFACALYPRNSAFLRNIGEEVKEQILRLRHHPSLLCWAGNNENELAIRLGWTQHFDILSTKWYPEWNYGEEAQANDYLALYKTTIQLLANSLDPSRPFLLSSPSNGVETEKEGGIAQNPGDTKFGDIHFYTETANLWRDQSYLVPRCASEFGVQSMPLGGTMRRWMDEVDWHYGSETLVGRQHHPGGIVTLPAMIFQHFPFPFPWSENNLNDSSLMNSSTNKTAFIDKLAFYSQAHQAIALQAQIEHYRRWRSQLDEMGQGRTMCALYWQLNDVWAAPTWSSVDFDLRWKMAHHFVRRSFSSVIVSMFTDTDQQFRLFVISDLIYPIRNVTLNLEMFVLQFGFQPIFSSSINLVEVPPLSANEVEMPTMKMGIKRGLDYEEDNYLVSAWLMNDKHHELGHKAVLLPDKMFKVGKYGKAKLTKFKRRLNASDEYELSILANNVLPIVWLDLSDEFKCKHPEVLYYFEENAFTMTLAKEKTKLKLFFNPNRIKIAQNDIQISVL